MQQYIPQRVGLLHQPPTIVIEYLVPNTQKLWVHRMKLLRLTLDSDVDEFVQYIRKRHKQWIEGKFSDSHLHTLVGRLQEQMRVRLKTPSVKTPSEYAEDNYEEDFEEESQANESIHSEYDYNTLNLNKMSPEEVQKHKERMDVVFKQNIKRPGDPGYKYDVQVDFKPTKKNEWDDDEDDYYEY